MNGLLGMIRDDVRAALNNEYGAPLADSAEGNAVRADRFMKVGKPYERSVGYDHDGKSIYIRYRKRSGGTLQKDEIQIFLDEAINEGEDGIWKVVIDEVIDEDGTVVSLDRTMRFHQRVVVGNSVEYIPTGNWGREIKRRHSLFVNSREWSGEPPENFAPLDEEAQGE